MVLDRYVKVVLTVIAVALVAIAVRPWLPESGVMQLLRPDPALAQMLTPRYEVTVPKSFGKLIGYSSGNLLMEDKEGALRVVDLDGKPPEIPKVRVLVRFQ